MLFQKPQHQTVWDEQDELAYIRQGEPLSCRKSLQFPSMLRRRRKARNPRNNVTFFFPIFLLMWIFHPLHQLLIASFEGDSEDDSLHSDSSTRSPPA
ncbi:hypothetical protein MHU86_1260 [Fragilaria crotonensis]|nr:hypothetical protein MHU86_1260 [Fragilaria crotonensis]